MDHVHSMITSMVRKFNLQDNSYVSDLFAQVDRWSEAFLPSRFCGRLRTTSPNESHHKCIKSQLCATTSLCQCLDVLIKLKQGEPEIPVRKRDRRFPFLSDTRMSFLWHFLVDKEIVDSYSVSRVEECLDEAIEDEERMSVQQNGRTYIVNVKNGHCTCGKLLRRGYPCCHVVSEFLRLEQYDRISSTSSEAW
jgi:hypothetical protein